MELANQIVEVDSELDLLLQSSENRDAIAETDQLFVELEPAYKNLDLACSTKSVLQSLPEPFAIKTSEEELSSINSMNSSVRAFRIGWDEHGYKLRTKTEKVTLLESINTFVDRSSHNNKYAWREFVRDLLSKFEVLDIELQSVKVVAKNSIKVDDFISKRESFRVTQRNFPQSTKDIQQLEKLARELTDIRQTIKWNPPKAVKEFFENLDSGVPLSELTTEIREWLEDNDALKDLHIMRRGRLWM